MVKKRRLDIIILIVLIVIAIGSWIAVTVLFDVNGDYVEVIVELLFLQSAFLERNLVWLILRL